MKRIVVDPPTSEARRERVERKLFEQLAAVRVVERAEQVIPPARPRRTPFVFAGGLVAAAAIVVFLALPRGDSAATAVPAPSRIVTPVGGTSQVTLPGALIEAQSDTSVEIQHGERGAITLVIARGAVECDVEPRPDRPPFRVLAGDVVVEVVGTRFTVTRTPSPRVDVARGKVRVTAPGGQWLVEAGEAWPSSTSSTRAAGAAATAPEPPVPVAEASEPAPIEMADDRVAPARKKPGASGATSTEAVPPVAAPPVAAAPQPAPREERQRARESYRIAARLEQTDPRKAAQLYRAIATDGKGMEAVALVSLAEVQLKLREPAAALATLDELDRRFPGSANAEDAAWFRYEALRALGKRDEARGAAADYLRKFPHGAYADRLSQPSAR